MRHTTFIYHATHMPKIEKNINKILIGAILGTTILWVAGATMTPKGKSMMSKVKDFIKWGVDELKKNARERSQKKLTSRDDTSAE